MYKLIDLFCGAGGMTLGFTDKRFSGLFQSVWAIDNDDAAVETFNANFGNHAVCGDIEQWLGKVPQADVVIGGPPCQGFSLLNKKRDGDDRRALWQPYLDIVERSKAKVFVIENVAALLNTDEHQAILDRAADMGFSTVSAKLNAADYGAPQTRMRAVIIGYKDSKAISFPPPKTHSKTGSELPFWRTVKDVIGDLKPPIGTTVRSIGPPYDLHFGREPTSLSLKRYKLIPPGGNRFDLQKKAPHLTPDCWLNKPSGGTDLFGRLWWDRPSVTIRTEFFKPEKGRYLHPDQHRPITHREAARLMGFPDDFVFNGSKTQIARQIGNAVPPHLAQAIALTVAELLKTKAKKAA